MWDGRTEGLKNRSSGYAEEEEDTSTWLCPCVFATSAYRWRSAATLLLQNVGGACLRRACLVLATVEPHSVSQKRAGGREGCRAGCPGGSPTGAFLCFRKSFKVKQIFHLSRGHWSNSTEQGQNSGLSHAPALRLFIPLHLIDSFYSTKRGSTRGHRQAWQ